MGVTNPEGQKRYICAAFPSACGKTNLAMMQPSLPGWRIETVGDDIAWMRFGPDGRLYAVNPEFGFFGVAPGTSMQSNPNALISCRANSVFTNVGMTEDLDVYWEGMDVMPKGVLTDWKRRMHWKPTLTPDFKGGYKINDKLDPCAQVHQQQQSRPRVTVRRPTRVLRRRWCSAPCWTPSGTIPTACPSLPSSWAAGGVDDACCGDSCAAAGTTPCRWCSRPATGPTALSSPPSCAPLPPAHPTRCVCAARAALLSHPTGRPCQRPHGHEAVHRVQRQGARAVLVFVR